MDYRINFQLKEKKPWWSDGVFYVVVSLLIVLVFSYGILILKNYQQRIQVTALDEKLSNVGTEEQRKQESEVMLYQRKISDFTALLNKHTLTSNAFSFIQKNTVSNVWLKQFALDQKLAQIQLSGQADNLEVFSKQVANFEKNKYVKSVGVISSSVDNTKKVDFSFNLLMDPIIFSSLTSLTDSPVINTAVTAGLDAPVVPTVSSKKDITYFKLLLEPEVLGTIDQDRQTIRLSVPEDTDVKKIKTVIIISPKARISPDTTLPLDFTNPVVYTVTAEDGSEKTYQVTVTVDSGQPQPISKPVEQENNLKPVNEEPQNLLNLPAIIFIATLLILLMVILVSTVLHFTKGQKSKSPILPHENE